MSESYLGEIRIFAGNYAIEGWALCDGSLQQISQNQALFNLIGTIYGGDGVNTFALPDLRGRALIHQGTAAAGTSYVMGQAGGAEGVVLNTAALPAHTHPFSGLASAGTVSDPGPAVGLASTPSEEMLYDGTTSAQVSLAPSAVDAVGSGLAHENRQPYLAISYLIAIVTGSGGGW